MSLNCCPQISQKSVSINSSKMCCKAALFDKFSSFDLIRKDIWFEKKPYESLLHNRFKINLSLQIRFVVQLQIVSLTCKTFIKGKRGTWRGYLTQKSQAKFAFHVIKSLNNAYKRDHLRNEDLIIIKDCQTDQIHLDARSE